MSANNKFGEYIRKLRVDGGLTLTELAAQLKLDSGNLSKIENGKREFDEKRLPLLAKTFKLDIIQLKKEYFSDAIASKIYIFPDSNEILALAEAKVKYYKSRDLNQSKINFDNE